MHGESIPSHCSETVLPKISFVTTPRECEEITHSRSCRVCLDMGRRSGNAARLSYISYYGGALESVPTKIKMIYISFFIADAVSLSRGWCIMARRIVLHRSYS